MPPAFLPVDQAGDLDHLDEYAPPGERARNQLLLVVSVFAVALALRLAGQGWPVTLAGGALGGLVGGMVALELWERATGRRSARRATVDRLTPAIEGILGALADDGARTGAAVSGEEAGVRWIVSVRTDAPTPPAPDALTSAPPAAAPVPVSGVRYRPQDGAVAVLPGAWVRVEARAGTDPLDARPVDREAAGDRLLADLPEPAAEALRRSGGRAALGRALRVNRPWPHRLRLWPAAVVVTLPLTDALTPDHIRALIPPLRAWQAARPGPDAPE